jgi:hypothetical protein
MDTMERLIRFRVVAVYHRYDSKIVSFVIHPDQSMAQIIPNVRSVSTARKIPGLWKIRPTWAIVPNSTGAGRWRRSRSDRPRFIVRSPRAQITMVPPEIVRRRSDGLPIRIAVAPKSSLNKQKGMPIVRLKKNGRWKSLPRTSPSFVDGDLSLPLIVKDIIPARNQVV